MCREEFARILLQMRGVIVEAFTERNVQMRTPSVAMPVASGNVLRVSSTEHFRLSERLYHPCTESPLHTHTKSYIIITVKGQYHSTFGTRAEVFKRWTVSLHHEGVPHTSRYTVNGAKVLYIEVPLEYVQRLIGPTASHMKVISVQGGLPEWTARQLYREFDTPDELSPVMLDSLTFQLFAQLGRRHKELPRNLPTWLGRADEIIRERFTDPVGLELIAQAVRVHPTHLAREYRRHYHCTVGEQMRRLRIEYACEQLGTTNHPLADIALAAGFSDQSHFAVGFKQQIGTSPLQYRRAMQSDAAQLKKC
jgi:AraC family transcriptional regulator